MRPVATTSKDLINPNPRHVGSSARAAVAWAVGCGGAVAQVAWNGPNGVRGAAVLAAGSALLVAGLAVVRRHPPLGVVAAVAAAVVMEVWSSVFVGRAPGLMAASSVVVVALGTGLVLRSRDRSTWSTVPAVALAGLIWWAGPTLLAPTMVLVAGVVAVVRIGDPLVLDGLERWSRRWLRSVVAAVARFGSASHAARWSIGIGVAVAVVTLPTIYRLSSDPTWIVRGVNDYQAHYDRVVALTWSPFFMSVPHPGFHAAVQLAGNVLGPAWSMTAVVVAAAAAFGVVLYRCGRSRWFGVGALRPGWAAALVAAVLLGESPAVLVPAGSEWWQRAPGYAATGRGAGFLNLHIWGSPTITMAAPFVLALVPLAITLLQREHTLGRRWAVATVAAAGCLVLPAAALAMVPAAVGLILVSAWPGGDASRGTRLRRSAWFVVPSVAVCLWQVWFLATSQSAYEEATWTFNPFWIVEYVGMLRPVFWSLLLVPLVAWWSGGRRYVNDPAVVWTAAATFVALFPMFLLQETGWKATHGGMAVSFGVCCGLFVTISVRSLVLDLQDAWDARGARATRPATLAAAGLLGACVMAGTLDLLASSGLIAQW